MSITTPERTHDPEPHDTDWVTDARPAVDDSVVVTCGSCNASQRASGGARGYVCASCGTDWEVLRCRGCREVSIILANTSVCPRCGHEHQRPQVEAAPRVPAWLVEPDPLSVWLGGVKYLGGHAERDEPIAVAGLLLDRRGVHLRAFSELFSISWDTILGISIEGPVEISERMTTRRLLSLGANTWAMTVAYLTVRTTNGDAVFEVNGLAPPDLHARLSRVLQGLQRSDDPPAPIALDRGVPLAPEPEPSPVPVPVSADAFVAMATEPRVPESHTPVDIDPQHSAAPLEVLVIDALWKLARVREAGLIEPAEVELLRTRLLAQIIDEQAIGSGPLLHV